ncbi:MAG: CubicO group peptidase (beta-lactamase class C family), partial [Halieaceae bacterium]
MPGKLLIFLLASLGTAAVRAEDNFDYFEANRQLIRNGVQAVLTCNGLYTSQRSIQQVFAQELAYLGKYVLGDASGGAYTVVPQQQAVSVGGGVDGPVISAAFRAGIGCVVMAPEMPLSAVDGLPELRLPYPTNDPEITRWPDGDAEANAPVPETLAAAAIADASDWAFERDTPEQDTISLLIVHQGKIIHERYAQGFDRSTRTRTFSTAKSIAATLIGMQVDSGELSLDAPLDIQWLPEVGIGEDPRQQISLRHLLNMSSGLYPVDSFNMEYATGSGLAYWAGASSVDGARKRGLIRKPGSHWDYENYDTLLAVHAFKNALPDQKSYLEFPRKRLLDTIGMR